MRPPHPPPQVPRRSIVAVLVRFRGEGVGVELLVRQPAQRDEVGVRRVDHHRCAAGVHLMARQVGQVGHHRAVDEAGAAAPVVFGKRIADHRHVVQVRHLGGHLPAPGVQVQVMRPPAAPVQDDRAGHALGLHVLEHRLHRREAGARAEQHHRLVRCVAQEEAAEGAFEAKDLLVAHAAEHMVGEAAAGHVAKVQLDRRRAADAVHRVGHRVAAPRAVAQDDLDVLAGAVLQVLVRRQLQPQECDTRREALDAHHPRRELQHRVFAGAGHAARFDDAVGLRHGAAGQDQARLFLGDRQRLVLVRAVDHAPRHEPALARAAGAVAAAVRHADALADRGGEHGLVGLDLETAAGRLDGDGEAHDRKPRGAGGRRAEPDGRGGRDRRDASVAAGGQCALTLARRLCPGGPDVHDGPRRPAMPNLPTRRFTRPSLLIVGCGDIGLRVSRLLRGRWRVLALSPSPERFGQLRAAGAVPLFGDLDHPPTLGRLAGLADDVLHLAPPPADGDTDPRTLNLLRALARRGRVRRLVYASTTGVYGDCAGARIDETRAPRPATARARRRADAEARARWYGRLTGAGDSILRIPGIYAFDRPGGDPRERLRRGTPVLDAEHDVYTNHIHADDLARACVAALQRAAPQRVYHASDDSDLRMGEYFDLVADRCGLPRPPRLDETQARVQLSPLQLSFMRESRRLDNRRLKHELRLRLRYPTVAQALLGG